MFFSEAYLCVSRPSWKETCFSTMSLPSYIPGSATCRQPNVMCRPKTLFFAYYAKGIANTQRKDTLCIHKKIPKRKTLYVSIKKIGIQQSVLSSFNILIFLGIRKWKSKSWNCLWGLVLRLETFFCTMYDVTRICPNWAKLLRHWCSHASSGLNVTFLFAILRYGSPIQPNLQETFIEFSHKLLVTGVKKICSW